jgi:Protein of unknown function (DUF3108)
MLFAAAVSGAVHATVIAFGRLEPEKPPADLPPLAVRIANASPEAVGAAAPPPRPRTAKPARVSPASAVAARLPAPVSGAPEGAEAAEEPQAPEIVSADGPEPQPETAAAPEPEPQIVATAPSSTAPIANASLPAFPRSGRIAYTLVYGRDRYPVGRTVQSWKIDGRRYQLASRSETTGLADFFRSQHRTYFSRGELTPEGLRPETFLMSRNRGRGVEEARATFHWTQGTVVLGGAANLHEEPLPRGSQDLVSFMYQLAMDPPSPGRRNITITNGTRMQTQVLDVLAEQKIETPLGVLRALPVKQVRKTGNESVDVWLAVEYRHLPVRIRFYGRDGEPTGEQIVTEIRLSED